MLLHRVFVCVCLLFLFTLVSVVTRRHVCRLSDFPLQTTAACVACVQPGHVAAVVRDHVADNIRRVARRADGDRNGVLRQSEPHRLGAGARLGDAVVPLGLCAGCQHVPVVSGLSAAQPAYVLHVSDPSGRPDSYGIPDAGCAAFATLYGADDILGQCGGFVCAGVHFVCAVRGADCANIADMFQKVKCARAKRSLMLVMSG